MLVSLSGDSVLAVGVYVSVGGFRFLCSLAIHWRPIPGVAYFGWYDS